MIPQDPLDPWRTQARVDSPQGSYEPVKEALDAALAFVDRHFMNHADEWRAELLASAGRFPTAWYLKALKRTALYQERRRTRVSSFHFVLRVLASWAETGSPCVGEEDRRDDVDLSPLKSSRIRAAASKRLEFAPLPPSPAIPTPPPPAPRPHRADPNEQPMVSLTPAQKRELAATTARRGDVRALLMRFKECR